MQESPVNLVEKFHEFKEVTFAFFENIADYKDQLERLLVKKSHIIKP